MPFVDLICLANSKKLGGWCIAGLRTDGGGWVRPVADTDHGQLYPSHMKLPDGSQPLPLDLLRISLKEPRRLKSQPENWLLSDEPWELLARPAPETMLRALDGSLERGPDILGTATASLPESHFDTHPAASSLALIAPTGLRWHVAKNPKGHRQLRMKFRLRDAKYDLSVTDVAYERQTRGLTPGEHPFVTAGISLAGAKRIRLTVSLSEPFHGDCYKLVAGVLLI